MNMLDMGLSIDASLGVVFWIICALMSYSGMVAHFVRQWPEFYNTNHPRGIWHAKPNRRHIRLLALCLAILGPLGLLFVVLETGAFRQGFMFRFGPVSGR